MGSLQPLTGLLRRSQSRAVRGLGAGALAVGAAAAGAGAGAAAVQSGSCCGNGVGLGAAAMTQGLALRYEGSGLLRNVWFFANFVL